MLNLKEELAEYLADGSINYNKLKDKISAILKATSLEGNKASLKPEGEKGFISKVKSLGTLSFRFADKSKGSMQILIVKEPKIENGDTILVSSLKIENIKPAVVEETEDDETPMWIDNEWYRDDEGEVWRWRGRKSYDVKSEDHQYHILKNIKTGEIVHAGDNFSKHMDRVEPRKKGNKISYINKETDV